MAKIVGEIYCSYCDEAINWEYEKTNAFKASHVEDYNPNVVHPKRISSFFDSELEFRIICPHCGGIFKFVHNPNNKPQ